MKGPSSTSSPSSVSPSESEPLVSPSSSTSTSSYSHLPVSSRLVRGKSQPPWTKSLYSRSNVAIVASYLCVGFTASFIATPLSVYLVKELGAQPEEQVRETLACTTPNASTAHPDPPTPQRTQ